MKQPKRSSTDTDKEVGRQGYKANCLPDNRLRPKSSQRKLHIWKHPNTETKGKLKDALTAHAENPVMLKSAINALHQRDSLKQESRSPSQRPAKLAHYREVVIQPQQHSYLIWTKPKYHA
jgi:hypothetical protein